MRSDQRHPTLDSTRLCALIQLSYLAIDGARGLPLMKVARFGAWTPSDEHERVVSDMLLVG